MLFIGYGGNALLCLWIEAIGIIRNPINLINPLYHVNVLIRWLTTPLSWLLILVTLAGVGLNALTDRSQE